MASERTNRRNAAAQRRLADLGVRVPRKGAYWQWRKLSGQERGLSKAQIRGKAPAGQSISELRRAGVRIPKQPAAVTPVGRLAPVEADQLPPGTHPTFANKGAMTLREALATVAGDAALSRLAQNGMVHIVKVYGPERGYWRMQPYGPGGRLRRRQWIRIKPKLVGYHIEVDDETPPPYEVPGAA